MKKRMVSIVAMILALVMVLADPLRVLADSQPMYISDVKVGMAKKAADAEKALEGYTILTDDKGQKVDLNYNAGGDWASKGDKVVYLGYKTTTDSDKAITDLALMNMKGGYSVEDYDALMEGYLNQQIIPFVETFIAAIKEYRENYSSSIPDNKTRAQYVHDALNKYTDDDCNDAPLGDLLLNETKYEMGDAAYDALSAAEKAKHADIVTLIAQANGMATLIIERLLVNAADTEETTWIQRLPKITYEDLLVKTGFTLSKAQKEVDKLYYDDAMKLLEVWDTFREQLEHYDEAVALVEELQNEDLSEEEAIIENFKGMAESTEEEQEALGKAMAKVQVHSDTLANALADVACADFLKSVEYEDGTLFDLFLTPAEEIDEDITLIYPVVAALSPGQRAGIELLTLEELVMMGATNQEGYKKISLNDFEVSSVYFGVDRQVYEKGGVGLTSDALRARAEEFAMTDEDSVLSPLTYFMLGLTAVSVVAVIAGLGSVIYNASALTKAASTVASLKTQLARLNNSIALESKNLTDLANMGFSSEALESTAAGMESTAKWASETRIALSKNQSYLSRVSSRSATCSKLTKGLGVAMMFLVAITTYMSYRDMVNHYKVEFTPIPRYMVDEKDITAFNSKGEKIVIKNQSAYYRAALCNRSSSAEYFDTVGDVADLNGDVGKQWLALYYSKNEAELPILANSLKAVKGDNKVPENYTMGIHMFGTGAAENLNNPLYIWNSDAPGIYVYYQLAESRNASLTGSGFGSGTLALSAIGGAGVGALVSGIVVSSIGKKKKQEPETV